MWRPFAGRQMIDRPPEMKTPEQKFFGGGLIDLSPEIAATKATALTHPQRVQTFSIALSAHCTAILLNFSAWKRSHAQFLKRDIGQKLEEETECVS